MYRICALLLLTTTFAFAQENNRGWFFGVHAGNSDFSDWEQVSLDNFDDSDLALGFQGGFQYNRYIALEAFFTSYGETTFGNVALDFGGEGDADALGITLNGMLPLSRRLNLEGKLGIVFNDSEVVFTTLAGTDKDDDSGMGFVAAFGFRYELTDSWDLGLHYEALSPSLDLDLDFLGNSDPLDAEDLNTIKLSLSYKF
ncbi:MAG: outer membrane beta-barrel protein [Acidobacteriota bacterium]|nr:outer membrane beta-barrel protein [Acidobacteriota bacterium]